MEYTQWEIWESLIIFYYCLNPCCNGIYSMREYNNQQPSSNTVLILVVMEYTQWVSYFGFNKLV